MDGRAKVVCTIGPATASTPMLTRLIASGMDVARFNFSHGTADEHLRRLANLREAMQRSGAPITVVQDLQGPKIRIGEFRTPFVELVAGARFTITTEPIVGTGDRVSTTFAALPEDVHSGDMVLIDDGKIRLRAVTVRGSDVVCEVVTGGKLSAHKGINLPGVPVSAPSLTEKDRADLAFGLANDVDCVALSFVRTAEDVHALRHLIGEQRRSGGAVPIIAKIEKPQAVDNIDSIIAAADVVMVARGDLGVELPPEDVPMLQKMIVAKCNEAGKPVIIATQMLESMIGSPTPTRAEANDVANAVVDGADAVMLSGETSVGAYPVESVEIMERIIRKVESEISRERIRGGSGGRGVRDRLDALGESACVLAEQVHAAAIVTVTHSGQTARAIARHRPASRIIAVTDRVRTLRLLGFVWGVSGIVVDDLSSDSDKALAKIQECLLASGKVERGAYVVLLAGQPFFARGSTNFIKVEKVE
jgi:pyruvate kinase